jgi:hypothetical protein
MKNKQIHWVEVVDKIIQCLLGAIFIGTIYLFIHHFILN